jgi:hypothetical protein
MELVKVTDHRNELAFVGVRVKERANLAARIRQPRSYSPLAALDRVTVLNNKNAVSYRLIPE